MTHFAIAALATGLAAAAVSADGAKEPPAAAPPADLFGEEVEGLSLAISVQRRWERGTVIMPVIKVRNTTDEPCQFTAMNRDQPFEAEVRDAKGEVVPTTRYSAKARADAATPKRLPPFAFSAINDTRSDPHGVGGHSTYEHAGWADLNQLYDLSLDGEYTITAKRSIVVGEGKGLHTIFLTTPPTRFRIVQNKNSRWYKPDRDE